jgi:hypothetical protein
MDASALYRAILPVCPCKSTKVIDPNDRGTWSFVPGDTATPGEITAGNNVIATVPVESLSLVFTSDFITRWTDAEYLLLQQQRATDTAAGNIGNARNWDQLMAMSSIDMNMNRIKALKAQLVTDGILTQARADVIFS